MTSQSRLSANESVKSNTVRILALKEILVSFRALVVAFEAAIFIKEPAESSEMSHAPLEDFDYPPPPPLHPPPPHNKET